jgi:hypothetical protein
MDQHGAGMPLIVVLAHLSADGPRRKVRSWMDRRGPQLPRAGGALPGPTGLRRRRALAEHAGNHAAGMARAAPSGAAL